MAKRYPYFWFVVILVFASGIRAAAQNSNPQNSSQGTAPSAGQNDSTLRILVNVNLVQLNVAVTDNKGNYITGLRPEDFAITEDRIPEKIATFEEGNGPTRTLIDVASSTVKPAAPVSGPAQSPAEPPPAQPDSGRQASAESSDPGGSATQKLGTMAPGANIFILFDTSNYMYRGFVFAQDAIANFVRSLGSAGKVAFYSYSRDLSRDTAPTSDESQVLRGLRSTVAGANSALYDSLLLTVEDAARYTTGRKVVVVFSNGPDDASLVPPEDVAELAQSTGTIIYMVGTEQAHLEPASTTTFERISKVTGGKAYFARSWSDEARAFTSIREDMEHLYSLSYYPQSNPNQGWRAITVKLVGPNLKKYHLRTRDGYRLQAALGVPEGTPAMESSSK